MKGYFKASFIAGSLLATVCVLFLGACSDVDDTLGLGLVPDDQKVELHTEVITGVKSYSAFSDSIPTSHLRRMAFGSMKTSFGRTTLTGVYQFMPLESFAHRGGQYYFGKDAVLDSAYIVLYISKITGKTRTPQTFRMFPLKETMDYGQVYYPNYDVSANVEADPVFEFTMEKEITGARYKKLWDARETSSADYQKRRDYLMNILNLPNEVWKDEDVGEGLFHKAVPGFYIAPYVAPGEPEGEAVYEVIMADSYYQTDLSYISIYTHTGTGDNLEKRETKFYFDDKRASSFELSNLSIILIEHDYDQATNGIDPSDFLMYVEDDNGGTGVMPPVTEDDGQGGETEIVQTQDFMFVQDMAGAAGYINFNAEFRRKLSDLLTYDETQFSSIFLNRAKLVVPVALDSEGKYDGELEFALKRLGLYLDYKGDLPVNVPDYPYMSEIVNTYESPFGGYLNYSKLHYEMDVSTYIRQLINNPENTRSKLWIAPAFNSNGFSRLQEVKLVNTPERPIKLEITYTLIK